MDFRYNLTGLYKIFSVGNLLIWIEMLRFYRIVLKLYTRIVGISGKSSRGDSWKERECACHSRHFYWQEHWPDAVLMQNHKQIIAIHIRRSANSWEFSQLLPCCCPNNAFAPSKYPVSGQELKLIHWLYAIKFIL